MPSLSQPQRAQGPKSERPRATASSGADGGALCGGLAAATATLTAHGLRSTVCGLRGAHYDTENDTENGTVYDTENGTENDTDKALIFYALTHYLRHG